MKVTNKITIHLDDLREIRPVDVMQCDVHTRELEIALFAGGKKWEIPNSVTPVISYRKPDGTKGLYDTLPNGNPACRIEANVVRAVLPPSALEAPGRVDLVLIFTDDDDNQLAAFGVPVDVHRNPGVGAVASGDYFNLQKWVKETAVAAVPKALPNPQKLILTGTVEAEYDGSGEVKVEIPVGGSKDVHVGPEPPTNGEAIWINPDEDPEDGGAVSPEAIKRALDEYMVEHPETDPTVPAWAKQPKKPKYTAEEVGALPADTPLPSGGGSKWRLIGEVTTTEAVSTVEVYGETPLSEMLVYTSVPAIDENPGGTAYYKVKMMSENGTLSDKITGILVTKPYTKGAIRHIFRVDPLGGSAQKWDAGSGSSPSNIGFTEDAALGIRNAHLNGYVLVGFQIYWNQKCTFPVGVHIQVWGR